MSAPDITTRDSSNATTCYDRSRKRRPASHFGCGIELAVVSVEILVPPNHQVSASTSRKTRSDA
eukprot:1035720-Rhodomonas_salina.3